MPIYEYLCQECKTKFDALRSMRESDSPIQCNNCDSGRTSRLISLFAAHCESGVIAGGGNGCSSSCASGKCSSCGTH